MPAQPPTLLIIGAGGHGRVAADAALAQGTWARVHASDRDPARCVSPLLPGIVAQPLEEALRTASAVHVAIGSPAGRERELRAAGSLPLASIVHPRASVSPHAEVGPGSFVGANGVVAPGAVLGRSVIVNHGAVVDHDARVGELTHVAPLASLGGGVHVGARVLVGSGASVLPEVRIADGAVIGAGAVVIADIEAAGVYAGVPARRVR